MNQMSWDTATQPMPDDVVGRYFAARREQGLDLRFSFGAFRDDATWSWRSFSHARYDGLGALTEVMTRDGEPWTLHYDSRPRPSLWRQILAAFRHRQVISRGTDPWLLARRPSSDARTAAWFVLDAAATEQVDELAKEAGVTPNSWLLWSLHWALVDAGWLKDEALWALPVNLRGPLRLQDKRSNHVGDVPTHISRRDSARDVHARIVQGLRSGLPWGPLWLLRQVARLGAAGFRYAASLGGSSGSGTVGVFSNLGSWNGSDRTMFRIAHAPVGPDGMLGVGLIRWNGAQSFCITVHEHLSSHVFGAEQVREAWVAFMAARGVALPAWTGEIDGDTSAGRLGLP